MPRISSKHFENFGDGLLTICEADERSLTRTKHGRPQRKAKIPPAL